MIRSVLPAALLVVGAHAAGAQMLALPVLQSPFLGRRLAVAGNYGSSDGAKVYAGAVAIAPGTVRFSLSAGVGAYRPSAAGLKPTQLTAGIRLTVPLLRAASGAVGVAAFGGVGGARLSFTAPAVAGAPNAFTQLRVPIGASVGYRRALGTSRAVALYAAPIYDLSFTRAGDVHTSGGLFRAAAGVDVAVTRAIGVTLGYETGQTATHGDPGARGGILGVGVAFVPGRR